MSAVKSAAEPAPVRRIAVLRPNRRIGNTLMLTPLLQELEMRFPDAQIELVTTCGAATTLLQRYPQVTAVHTILMERPLSALRALLALRRRSYDLAIDPVRRSRTGRGLLAWLRARDRVGFRWGVALRDRTLTHAADPRQAPLHLSQLPLFLLRSAYYPRPSVQVQVQVQVQAGDANPPLELRLTDAERRDGERRLSGAFAADGHGAARVAIYAHATGVKSYPVEWWRQMVECLRRESPTLQLLEIVPADRRSRLDGLIPGLYTPDLRLLGATLAATSLVVIPDGGVMHLAEAAGARVLALFRTTEPAYYGPCRADSEVLWTHDLRPETVAARIQGLLQPAADAAAE
ncbi:MAG: glycosyltransferase family 9 protein [Steroidobacteraceae bacterium]